MPTLDTATRSPDTQPRVAQTLPRVARTHSRMWLRHSHAWLSYTQPRVAQTRSHVAQTHSNSWPSYSHMWPRHTYSQSHVAETQSCMALIHTATRGPDTHSHMWLYGMTRTGQSPRSVSDGVWDLGSDGSCVWSFLLGVTKMFSTLMMMVKPLNYILWKEKILWYANYI